MFIAPRLFVPALALLATCFLSIASAQKSISGIELTNGNITGGEIIAINKKTVVLGRKIGTGTMKQTIKFSRIAPYSLHALLSTGLAPLDSDDHLLIARNMSEAKLFATAGRHFKNAIELRPDLNESLKSSIELCRSNDIQSIMKRSEKELTDGRFSRSRKLALLILRRYPDSQTAKSDVPRRLAAIQEAYNAAIARERLLAKSAKARAEWKRGERQLEEINSWLARARDAEASGLQDTQRFRRTKDLISNGVRYLQTAEKLATKLRRPKKLPEGLLGNLRKIEDRSTDMAIRLRLHLASLYSMRGSFGSAYAYVNAALAIDPTDKQALAARSRIEESSAAASVRYGGLRR